MMMPRLLPNELLATLPGFVRYDLADALTDPRALTFGETHRFGEWELRLEEDVEEPGRIHCILTLEEEGQLHLMLDSRGEEAELFACHGGGCACDARLGMEFCAKPERWLAPLPVPVRWL
ncbi:hypothetical protein [Endothiovibrio diazotrophicus]